MYSFFWFLVTGIVFSEIDFSNIENGLFYRADIINAGAFSEVPYRMREMCCLRD